MHKRSLCRRAVSVRPYVCLPGCSSRSCILSNRVNIFANFCYHRVATSFCFFSIPNVIAYLDRDISKSRFSTNIWLWHRSDAGPSRVVNNSTVDYRLYYLCVVRLPRSTNSVPRVRVNLVYDRKPRRYTEENRVEFNYTHWII